uniref:Uncharacterized protein n=1 Tax=Molossus molossus TaxID=27622 RepID=A0A7J8FTX2_MOLMO|nr:hypothetical protein HJG59_008448 [Molossus molossus]
MQACSASRGLGWTRPRGRITPHGRACLASGNQPRASPPVLDGWRNWILKVREAETQRPRPRAPALHVAREETDGHWNFQLEDDHGASAGPRGPRGTVSAAWRWLDAACPGSLGTCTGRPSEPSRGH